MISREYQVNPVTLVSLDCKDQLVYPAVMIQTWTKRVALGLRVFRVH